MKFRYYVHRTAASAFVSPERLRGWLKKAARKSGLERLLRAEIDRLVHHKVHDELYPQLVARVRQDLAVDGLREHMSDLVGLLDARLDRICRELAREDPALRFEQPEQPKGKRK